MLKHIFDKRLGTDENHLAWLRRVDDIIVRFDVTRDEIAPCIAERDGWKTITVTLQGASDGQLFAAFMIISCMR
ncbi:hypothetical protein [Sphingobium sp. EM0848]|uniref:hypothetical protein n=1 Tax=Sphingobium sp. EM0848 TaxID=2743473 RepID=UPI00159C2851|nr:hypothetical protein [Sphingobium sp. EM0848]